MCTKFLTILFSKVQPMLLLLQPIPYRGKGTTWLPRGGHKRQCASTLFTGILAFEGNCYQASILSALRPSCVRKVNLTLMERSEGEACDYMHPLCLHPHPTICYSNNHHHMRNLESQDCPAKPFPYFWPRENTRYNDYCI